MPAPQIRSCILCEDARFERRGIVSLIGAFGSLPEVTIYVRGFDKPTRICFGFFTTRATGKFVFEAEILSPDGKILGVSTPPKIELTLDSEKGPTFFAFWFNTVVFSVPNQYTVALRVDGNACYKDTFKVTVPPSDTLS